MICTQCNNRIPREGTCSGCGRDAVGTRFCPYCGTERRLPKFCPFCGHDLANLPDNDLEGVALAAPPGWVGAPPRPRKWPSRVIGCGCLPASMIVALILVGAAQGDYWALSISVAAAVLPAILFSRIVLSLDKYEKEPTRVLLFAFGWGSVGAILLALIAEVLFSASLVPTIGDDAADAVSIVIGAPFIEEAVKGLALLLLLWFYRDEVDNVLDGLIYGAIIGIGFAMTENIVYFIAAYQEDGANGLGSTFVIRVLINGFGHAMYTGITGAAVGWSRSRYSKGWTRMLVPILGYLLAVFFHMAWNGGLLLIWSLMGEDAPVWKVLLFEVPIFVVPPLAVLGWIALRSASTEQRVLVKQLEPEIAYGVLTQTEFQATIDPAIRDAVIKQARRNGGWKGWREQRRLFNAAADLAYRKHHAEQTGTISPKDWWGIELDRQQIWRSRKALDLDNDETS